MKIEKALQNIEYWGNKLPHPTWLFIYLCGIVLFVSAVLSAFSVSAVHPVNGTVYEAKSLLTGDGLRWILSSTVKNFTQFAPVGTVLVAVLGLGVAERSGLIAAVLKGIVRAAPKQALSFVVVFAGVLSSLASDAGYVVLVPLAAMLFHACGRSPLLGIAAAFAGVSGGYSANLLIGPLDAILAGLSSEAMQLVEAGYEVSPAANYYFLLVSTLVISAVATFVTEVIVAPQFKDSVSDGAMLDAEPTEKDKALRSVAGFSFVFWAMVAVLTVPEWGLLRHPDTGSILRSPFISGIVVLIAVYAGLAGMLYGKLSGSFSQKNAVIDALDQSMGTMASYLVLMFFAAQFVNYFAWTDLGIIFAIKGAAWLSQWQLPAAVTLAMFVLLAGFINLLIGSASAKWALLAPVFIPMFYLLGIQPEAVQMAYRIGDSTTNIITPLMPYFGVIVAFAQRYDKDTGVGTLMAMMLPYSIAMLVVWLVVFVVWMLAGLPLGPTLS